MYFLKQRCLGTPYKAQDNCLYWDWQIWHKTYGRPIRLWRDSQGLVKYLEVSQKALDTTVEAIDCSDNLAGYNRSSDTSFLSAYI